MTVFHARFVAFVPVALTLALVPGGCGLKRRHRCTATATYEGKARKGLGTDFDSEPKAKAQAVRELCVNYCQMEDPTVGSAYQKERGTQPDDTVTRLNILNREPVLPLFDACKAKCDSAMAATAAEISCEYSGI